MAVSQQQLRPLAAAGAEAPHNFRAGIALLFRGPGDKMAVVNAPFTPPEPLRPLAPVYERLLAIASACPLAEDDPIDCPLHELRRLNKAEVRRWLTGLTTDEQRYLLCYHECCLAVKLERALFPRQTARPARPARPARRRAGRVGFEAGPARGPRSEIRHCTIP